MLTPENVILTLKIAVVAVTVLLVCSLTALALGRYRLHGRIKLLGLEAVTQIARPGMLQEWLKSQDALDALYVHLGFSLPAALVLPIMLYTGLQRHRRVHVALGAVFLVLWIGTFVTGVFFLPHAARP
jgi:uncharacterized membrane protein